MFVKSLAVVMGVVAAGFAFTEVAEAGSFIFDLDSRDPANGQVLNLNAGTYKIELLGILEGGTYDAWSAWANTTCPGVCEQTNPTSFTGWLQNFWIESDDITEITGATELFPDNYLGTDARVYNTALAANTAFNPIEFFLAADSSVDFEIRDSVFTDNRGGLTLKVSPVPEPSSILSLLAVGAITASIALRKK